MCLQKEGKARSIVGELIEMTRTRTNVSLLVAMIRTASVNDQDSAAVQLARHGRKRQGGQDIGNDGRLRRIKVSHQLRSHDARRTGKRRARSAQMADSVSTHSEMYTKFN